MNFTEMTVDEAMKTDVFRRWFREAVRKYQPDFEIGDKTTYGTVNRVYKKFLKDNPLPGITMSGSASFASMCRRAGLRQRLNARPRRTPIHEAAAANATVTTSDDVAVISRTEWNALLAAVSRIEADIKAAKNAKRGWFR